MQNQNFENIGVDCSIKKLPNYLHTCKRNYIFSFCKQPVLANHGSTYYNVL